MATRGKRTGRPAGMGDINKKRVLAAARDEFATKGFRGATMRSIATQAGVDVALLPHYFGNKDGLFAATMEPPDDAQHILTHALSGPPETQGERLTRGYLSLWENPATSPQMHALARSALTNEAAAELLQASLTGTIASSGASALLAGRQIGFTFAMTQLLGVAVARYLACLPQMVQLDFETLVSRIAPAVQLHLNSTDN